MRLNWKESAVIVSKWMKTIAMILPFVLGSVSTAAETSEGVTPVPIAASIFPLADIAQQVGGDRVTVFALIPAGANPHTFSLTPKQMKALADAHMIFLVGGHFDDWIPESSQTGLRADFSVVNVAKRIGIPAEVDPHYWLSGDAAIRIAEEVANIFSEVDSENEAFYRTQSRLYIAKLRQMNEAIRDRLGPYRDESIVTYHDAWRYFAEDYGIRIETAIEREGQDMMSPKHMRDLSDYFQTAKRRVVFAERGVPHSEMKVLASDFGLRIVELDPIGGIEGRSSYMAMMLFNANQIAGVLSSDD